MAQHKPDHDCAHEDALGLDDLRTSIYDVAHLHKCRECGHVWYLIDGMYFDPSEYDTFAEMIDFALTRSQS